VKIAIDVYYSDNHAKSIGVMFQNWEDTEPNKIITSYTVNPLEYESGLFYKRELPCIIELMEHIDISQIYTIIIDGYVYLNDDKKPGLGYYVYKNFEGTIPVIGVAKTPFHNNKAYTKNIYRGKSLKPLYISSIGIDTAAAAEYIRNMSGEYRNPYMLKLLDSKTKETD
jgi:deoxyribonuclease V